GVPDQVSSVHSIGDRASKFDPAEIVGAMPRLGTEATWQERAEAAHTRQAAQVAIPADTPVEIRAGLAEYTSQLSRPGADLGGLADQQADLIEQISWWRQRPDLQDAYDAPPTAGVSREDLRDAVADGLRGAHLGQEPTAPASAGGQGTAPASSESGAPAVPGEPVEDAPGDEADADADGALIFRPRR